MTDAVRVEEEAAAWLARLDSREFAQGGDVVAALTRANPEFARWIGASIQNRVAFLRLHAAWVRADRLAALGGARETPQSAALRKSVRRMAPWVAAAVAAYLAIVFLVDVPPYLQRSGPEVFETSIGGRETVPLADGSHLELNTDTRLTAQITQSERAVVLEKGEAFFDIARDETRPFVVEAGDRRITVLGTKFSVWRDGDDVEVVVAEGRVRIDDLTKGVVAPTVAERGAVVLARAEGTLVAEKTSEELDAELGWRQGLLIFDQMALENVAAEFNRYNRVKLVVDDPKAAAIRIGGSFKAENVDAFARLLQDGFGLNVERTENKIFIKS